MKKTIAVILILFLSFKVTTADESRIKEGIEKIKEGLYIILEELKDKSGEAVQNLRKKIKELEKELEKEKIKENIEK
ncbi:MAG: hypothetical protein GXO21_02485, partial [Aquificae bacterium]|nr:hypothetical protein [Aquificota bacterium]